MHPILLEGIEAPAPLADRTARHAGQRRVTLLGNKVADNGPAIPLRARSDRGNAVAVDQLKN